MGSHARINLPDTRISGPSRRRHSGHQGRTSPARACPTTPSQGDEDHSQVQPRVWSTRQGGGDEAETKLGSQPTGDNCPLTVRQVHDDGAGPSHCSLLYDKRRWASIA